MKEPFNLYQGFYSQSASEKIIGLSVMYEQRRDVPEL